MPTFRNPTVLDLARGIKALPNLEAGVTGGIEACRKAVHGYRNEHGMKEETIRIDRNGVYWGRGQ